MIGLDTNTLVRLIVDDDQEQAARARSAVSRVVADGKRLFVNRIVLAEVVWVMERAYKLPRAEICSVLDRLLNTVDLIVEDREVALEALERYRAGPAGFADGLIAVGNRVSGCACTLTFDRKAVRLPEFQHPA
ncbi:type II toxin-antitoxin system VapC family toxin [Azospirillum sp.]|uniref:PIN domain-containing protein n=1 Tax=Azospirillum sp. TaxID=34012 RepID=UPI002D5CEAE9|nr:type II toxin-antitoxin system VapC family toxin [Azospirillum sp.]HYF87642.1 type II toxin-antitoxin system VapC family toxin [Azospirillum sp.]